MPTYEFILANALADLAPLRAAQRETLIALPEFFVEMHVRRSALHSIEQEGTVGYIAVLDGTLNELYLVPEHREQVDAILSQAIKSLELKHAWAATFDPRLFEACTAAARSHAVLGLSFRTLNAVALPTPDPLPSMRLATQADAAVVHEANHPEVFDDPAEIDVWIDNGWLTLFEVPDGLAGFGLCTPTGPNTPAADIGIRVCPSYQRRGLGAWIVQRMAALAQSQGLVPTAGCGTNNPSSRRTLERAGFVADHRLVQFEF